MSFIFFLCLINVLTSDILVFVMKKCYAICTLFGTISFLCLLDLDNFTGGTYVMGVVVSLVLIHSDYCSLTHVAPSYG